MGNAIADLLTTSQAADRLGIERSTLSRWVQLGRIAPVHRLAGSHAMLFDPDDLDALAAEIETSRREPTETAS